MFDTMTMTKAVAAVCGSLLVFLLGNWAASAIYAVGGDNGEAAEGEITQAYTIDTGAAAPAEEGPEVDVAALMAAADAAAGEKSFSKCKACHALNGNDGTGPHLNGVVGRDIASVGGFSYSEGLAGHAGTQWTPETLFTFLESPKAFAPGTKMLFAGLPRPEERANLIAYLATVN